MNRTIYTLLLCLYLPIAVFKIIQKNHKNGDWFHKLKNQFGFVNKIPNRTIWIHCVSVGEFHAAIPLINQLIDTFPSHKLLITTTTNTGSKAVQKHYKERVFHCFFPLDLPFAIKRFIANVGPDICILLETEIWPNLVDVLYKQTIPTLLINARLSGRSFNKYRKYSPKLTRNTINKLTLIAAQNQNSAERFYKLGAKNNKVTVAGNIKFDQNLTTVKAVSQEMQLMIGDRKVIVFASTHIGEESQIISSYLKHQDSLDALLIIIPRHPGRFDEVYKLIKKNNIRVVKRSSNDSCEDAQFLLGDSMGEMMSYFDVCDVAFIGGSFSTTGGHNMLEAAALAKPILFGPNVFNFAEISSDLIAQNASIQVQNTDELFEEIITLLADEKRRQLLGNNAKQYFLSKRGAVDKTIKIISQHIKT
jgi:3-deoxy-D-manno-octulosonic-acid transferase